MSTTLTPPPPLSEEEERAERPSEGGGGGFGGRGAERNGGDRGGGGRDEWERAAQAVYRYRLGAWVGIGGIVMIFAAFTSAMVVRSGLGGDWNAIELPGVLWLSTAVLLGSSFTIEVAKRRMRAGLDGLSHWLVVTLGLGGVFVVSQVAGWAELSAQGIYLASNPSSSFFYLLTSAHAVHIVGGLLALSYAVFRVWRPTLWVTREAAIEATTIYWHFMDVLWIYLFVLLMVWR